jgi:glutamate/tyrosine decarboxylase-like PLP-dependent enzyme
MHRFDASVEVLTQAIVQYATDRVRLDPPPLDGPRTPAELRAMAGPTITAEGLGGLEALRIFADVLAPACISVDHPRFLSFVPAAPTVASILFDLVVGASSIYAGSWLEGAGAAFAENEALRWIADLAGLPPEAGGVFVSGGTAGNLSALVAARWRWRRDAGAAFDQTRGLLITSQGAHSSVEQAARAMDADVIGVSADDRGRMHGDALRAVTDSLGTDDRARLFAIVATSGTTNAGVVDDLAGVGDVCAELGVWMHVDGAYGGAGLAAPSVRDRYAGIEHADSFIVDPHKWLFAPFDSCALIYRDPAVARAAHTQHAEYLDVLQDDAAVRDGAVRDMSENLVALDESPPDRAWNPSDLAHHLSRRARGLPLWFSLAAHGTEAYTHAVEATLALARQAATEIAAAAHTELIMEPELSVVLFRRHGWSPEHYRAWSDRELARGRSFVTPTSWAGETVLRICIVNPVTTIDDIRIVIDSLAAD